MFCQTLATEFWFQDLKNCYGLEYSSLSKLYYVVSLPKFPPIPPFSRLDLGQILFQLIEITQHKSCIVSPFQLHISSHYFLTLHLDYFSACTLPLCLGLKLSKRGTYYLLVAIFSMSSTPNQDLHASNQCQNSKKELIYNTYFSSQVTSCSCRPCQTLKNPNSLLFFPNHLSVSPPHRIKTHQNTPLFRPISYQIRSKSRLKIAVCVIVQFQQSQ